MDPGTPGRRPAPTTPLSPLDKLGSRPAGPAARPPGGGIPVVPIHRPDPPGLASGMLVFCRWLQNLSIGLWLGIMLLIARLGPYALHYFHENRVDSGKFLGPLVAEWTKAGVVVGILYLVLMLIHDSLWRRYHATTAGEVLVFFKFILCAAIIGCCSYLLLQALPVMDHLRATATVVNGAMTGDGGKSFDHWHKIYEQLSGGMFLGGAALMLLSQLSRKRR
ncbi:MAG: hypothetical protein M3Y56_07810 [Armatimonadota bacterium]|nr:hypothetical protein [Armatimonadota bacterium]